MSGEVNIREEFARLLAERNSAGSDEAITRVRIEYESRLRSLWRRAHPRRRFEVYKAEAELRAAGRLDSVRSPFKARADAIRDAESTRRKSVESELRRIAPDVHIVPAVDPPGYTVAFRVWANEYHTQGGGADTYARVRAELQAALYQASGVSAWVESLERGACYEVRVNADSVSVSALDCRPTPMADAEIVRFVWAHGANPRVYWPLIPHGYEAEHGFDFFGRDLPTAGKDGAGCTNEPPPTVAFGR